MKPLPKMFLIFANFLAFNGPSFSCQQEDDFWANSSPAAMTSVAQEFSNFPNLDTAAASLANTDAATLALIGAPNLPGAPASTNVLADLQLVLNDLASGFTNLGAAVSIIFAQIGLPFAPGSPSSTNVILLDTFLLKTKVKATFSPFGQAITDVSALIQLPHQASLNIGIANVNSVLGAGGTTWFAPAAPDAFTKATNLLARLNAIGATSYPTIEAYVAAQGF